MKNLFNKSTKILLGLSVGLVLSSVGMIAFAAEDLKCACDAAYASDEPDVAGCHQCASPCERIIDPKNYLDGKIHYTCTGDLNFNSDENSLLSKCKGSIPTFGIPVNGSYYETNSNENDRWTHKESGDETCIYKCGLGYHATQSEGGLCLINECQLVTMLPDNAVANTDNNNPPDTNHPNWQYSNDKFNLPCTYHCKPDFEYKNGACVPIEASCGFFCQFGVDKINKILIGNVWDNIMRELDKLLDNVNSLTNELSGLSNTVDNQVTIPAGAIMAFDATKTNGQCPSGWSPFSEANGRFLMGASSEFGSKGGNNSIILQASQIPLHHHFMFHRGISNETPQLMLSSTSEDTYDFRYVVSDGVAGADYTMNSVTSAKSYHTDNDEDHFVKHGLTSSKLVSTTGNVISSQNSVNITNPYIKVLYCVKN